MPAHLRPLPKCRVCGKQATEALYNTRNAHLGDYCDAHAKAALRHYEAVFEATKPIRDEATR